jgi:membrane-associated protease RseP (regulator of RpoE activity)
MTSRHAVRRSLVLASLLLGGAASADPKVQTKIITLGSPGANARLGVALTDLTPELRAHFGAKEDAGVMVGSVQKDSAAEKAGLAVGDVIVAVDGTPATGAGEVRLDVAGKPADADVKIDVVRAGKLLTLTAKLGKPAPGQSFHQWTWSSDGAAGGARAFMVGGDDDRLEALEKKIEELQQRLDTLEKKK